MPDKFIRFAVAVLVCIGLTTASASADEPLRKELRIEGHGYEAVLEASPMLGIEESGDAGHYKGHFPEDSESWVRVSRINDRWEGLAFIFGQMHTIGGEGAERAASYSFSEIEAPACGVGHDHGEEKTVITPQSLTSPAMVQAVSASYDTLCAERVDGTCLLLELELAFDQQFQNLYPGTFQSRAASIMNMVEGFYADQFGIAFDTLSLNFPGNQVFSASSDAGVVLDDIANKRGNGEIPFLESERSLFHLISGRSFSGGVAGLAYVGSVCPSSAGVSNGVGTGLSSGAGSASETAVVVAHELGHNLGAFHDGEGNSCPDGRNIMSSTVNSSFDRFSSCSENEITSEISSRTAVEQCFNFPADAGIAELAGNPTEVTEGDTFTAFFDLAYQEASQSADGVSVIGSIGDGEGQLVSVSLNGAGCTITGNTGFSCAESVAQDGLRLEVEATAGATPGLNLLSSVTLVSDSGEVKDIVPGNNEVMTAVSVAEAEEDSGPDPGSGPGDEEPADPPGEEEPMNPSGDEPESSPPSTDSSSDSDSGGGGGGSASWLLLLAGLAGFRRLFRSAS